MTTIPVGRLAPFQQWDQHLIDLLLAGRLAPLPGLEFDRVDGYPHANGAIVIVPGRYWHERTAEINEAIQRYDWVLGMRVGDEADLFNIHELSHPNLKWWVQTPRADRDYGDARLFGCGYPPHLDHLPEDPPDKTIDVFLSGQDTNGRRHECFATLARVPNAVANPTPGFLRGLRPDRYTAAMADTKIAPCPAGPNTPCTFRAFEALESHALPIVDDITPAGHDSRGYWRKIFSDAPFPILTDYDHLPGWISDQLALWPANSNRTTAWWMRYKAGMARWLCDDLEALGVL